MNPLLRQSLHRVSVTSPPRLVRSIGGSILTSRGLRASEPPIDLQQLRTQSAQASTNMAPQAVKPLPNARYRRIIVCCDGTWQSSVSESRNIPSNVTRLCRHLARSAEVKKGNETQVVQQVVYYDSGIGTGSLSWAETIRQGAFGDGLAVKVLEAYTFIALNYRPGDEIHCFGFSRGAYTARSIAGMITDIGICEPRSLDKLPDVYALYKKNYKGNSDYDFYRNNQPQLLFREFPPWKDYVAQARAQAKQELEVLKQDAEADPGLKDVLDADAGLKTSWDDPDSTDEGIWGYRKSDLIKTVGVWDTVGSLGVPDNALRSHAGDRKQYGFHNVKLSDKIENAFHVLALHEKRKNFSPTLWYKKPESPTNLKQVWISGVHINAGGGSDDSLKYRKGDLEEMANISFSWMVEQLRPFLAFHEPSFRLAEKERPAVVRRLNNQPPYEQSWSEFLKNPLYFANKNKPIPHTADSWGLGPISNAITGAMKFGGSMTRTPAQCTNPDGELLSTKGITNEYIHPTVRFREEQMKERPDSLNGWVWTDGVGGAKWVNESLKLEIPEWQIAKDPETTDPQNPVYNLERRAGVTDEAKAFLKKRDEANFGA